MHLCQERLKCTKCSTCLIYKDTCFNHSRNSCNLSLGFRVESGIDFRSQIIKMAQRHVAPKRGNRPHPPGRSQEVNCHNAVTRWARREWLFGSSARMSGTNGNWPLSVPWATRVHFSSVADVCMPRFNGKS